MIDHSRVSLRTCLIGLHEQELNPVKLFPRMYILHRKPKLIEVVFLDSMEKEKN